MCSSDLVGPRPPRRDLRRQASGPRQPGSLQRRRAGQIPEMIRQRFVQEAPVLPSSLEALDLVRSQLEAERPVDASSRQIHQARLLSLSTLKRSRVLVPSTPGIKRLQSIIYTQLQRAMLGQISSDQAVDEAALQWNRYAEGRWPNP